MKRGMLIALLAMTPILGASCGGDDTAAPSTTLAQAGIPDPALPIDINTIPYKPGDLVALGNVSIQIDTPVTATDGTFSFKVKITSGALEPFTITSDMFRMYTVDGKSYLSESASGGQGFGNRTLQSREVYEGTFSVDIPTDSEPALFLADLSSIGDRFMPGAWVFDPNFEPAPSDG